MQNSFTAILLKLRNRHFLVIDLLILLATPSIALSLRSNNSSELASFSSSLVVATLVFVGIKLAVFYAVGIYRLFWQYASIEELALLGVAGLLALVLEGLTFFAVLRPAGLVVPDFPRSLLILESLLSLPAICSLRFTVRLAERLRWLGYGRGNAKRVLVAGAGEAGVMIVKEMQSKPHLGLHPVGFIDDDPQKRQARIRGVGVLGGCDQIPELVHETGAKHIIIAMPTASSKQIREMVSVCERVGAEPKIIPGISELLGGTISINQLRDVQIEDLLGREPVETDGAAVGELIRGKRILVTGGGGSIGSELCRQLLRCAPAELIIVGHGENSIFVIEHELRKLLAVLGTSATTRLTAVIADIRFADRIHRVFEEHRPDIVFHAAAHKHVPLMELNPAEAISNNVLGTRNLLDAAMAVDVEHFVMISSDKAVNPTSVMGASKRIAELLVHQAAEMSGKSYVAVRFGNVLGSRGSVLLTFRQQIAAGGPVTVTDPEMCRFFMTIPEAVQLTLQAAVLGKGGEVFVLDMGRAIKIVDLATDMITLSGLQVGRDIDIVFTGLRPGEKLFEELFIPGESYERTHHPKIFIAKNASSFIPMGLELAILELAEAAELNDRAAIIHGLQRIVPEFQIMHEEGIVNFVAA